MKRKGISPLLAAIILIALAMTVAAMFSGFITNFMQERVFETREDTGRLVDCSAISLGIYEDSVDTTDENVSFILDYRDSINLTGLRVVTFNETGDVRTDENPEPSEVEPLKPQRITANETVANPRRIQVFGEDCPDHDVVIEGEEDRWLRVF